MTFERTEDVLNWYTREERVLTPHFISNIPWNDVKKSPLDPAFLPILLYMRDVEHLTGIYYNELQHTPTVKDPSIAAFMDRWNTEEPVHAELLNRFLNEAGCPTNERWAQETRRKVPLSYRITSRLNTLLTSGFGHHFTAVHMTWGAINELSTLTGYERLWRAAKHPVLEYILKAIAREEARHAFFYWSAAYIKLAHSRFRQSLTRFIVNQFWTPVGQGAKLERDTNRVIRALFAGTDGLRAIDQRVNQRVEQLPGMEGLKKIRDHIAQVTGTLTSSLIG